MRKKNGIKPYRISRSSEKEKKKIRDFFRKHSDSFFFLFSEEDLIGSILHLDNYIQSLAITPRFQRQGYGRKLCCFCINRILGLGYQNVNLKVMEGNLAAEYFYESLGFVSVSI